MRTCIFIILSMIITRGALATEPAIVPATDTAYTLQSSDTDKSTTDTDGIFSRISINTNSPFDMNWTASMDLNPGDDITPTAQYNVVLPFLEKYPIENLEIKLKILNLQF